MVQGLAVDSAQAVLHPSVLVQLRLTRGKGWMVTTDHDVERQEWQN